MNIPLGADTRPILTESMFQAICAAGGWAPTPRRRGGLTAWAPYEGTPVWIFNPMATEAPDGPGHRRSTWSLGLPGVAPGQWNADGAFGVGIYATEADGAAATVATIRQQNFGPIAAWIDEDCQILGDAQRNSLVANMRAWGTTNFATLIGTGWNAPLWNDPLVGPPPSPPVATFTDAQVAAIKTMIDSSFGPILLAELRQILGLDPSTFSPVFQASVDQLKAVLTGATIPPHVHDPGSAPGGGVHR